MICEKIRQKRQFFNEKRGVKRAGESKIENENGNEREKREKMSKTCPKTRQIHEKIQISI